MSGPSGWYDDFEVLPEVTSDESATGWGEDATAAYADDGADGDEERLAWERPPHWDD